MRSAHLNLVRSLIEVAFGHGRKNEFEAALPHLQQARKTIATHLGNHQLLMGDVEFYLGRCQLRLLEPKKALFHFSRSRDIREKRLDPRDIKVANVLNNIGYCKALQFHQRLRDEKAEFQFEQQRIEQERQLYNDYTNGVEDWDSNWERLAHTHTASERVQIEREYEALNDELLDDWFDDMEAGARSNETGWYDDDKSDG